MATTVSKDIILKTFTITTTKDLKFKSQNVNQLNNEVFLEKGTKLNVFLHGNKLVRGGLYCKFIIDDYEHIIIGDIRENINFSEFI